MMEKKDVSKVTTKGITKGVTRGGSGETNSSPEKKSKLADPSTSGTEFQHETEYGGDLFKENTKAMSGEEENSESAYQEDQVSSEQAALSAVNEESEMTDITEKAGEDDEDTEEQSSYASFSELLRELGQESKMVILQYTQTFGESEAYEQQTCQGLADLKEHALLIEQDAVEKKKVLHSKLKDIMSVLSLNPFSSDLS